MSEKNLKTNSNTASKNIMRQSAQLADPLSTTCRPPRLRNTAVDYCCFFAFLFIHELVFVNVLDYPLCPTQPPVQWVPGALSLGLSTAGVWHWPLTPI